MDKPKTANDLRKEGQFTEALKIYEPAWEEKRNKFDGAGLLHCLRRLGRYDQAIPLADELIEKYSDFDWCKKEAIWTYLQGLLIPLDDNVPLGKIIDVATRIMNLGPDGIAAKMTVFKVLKRAKEDGDWETVNAWIVKLAPDSLATTPMTDEAGREGWNDQALWYNYRIKGLIESGNYQSAAAFADDACNRFPRQKKFFARLKAITDKKQGNLDAAEKAYRDLCSVRKPDWWLLHEYALVLAEKGRKNEALDAMYGAASSNSKLELLVKLFLDIGNLSYELGLYKTGRAHAYISKHVREEKGWGIPAALSKLFQELNQAIGDIAEPGSITEALAICRTEWAKVSRSDTQSGMDNRKPRKDLSGEIRLDNSDRPFCFINSSNGESFFCLKKDLPPGLVDGENVQFNAIPSYDKAKQKASWRASFVRKI